MSRPRVARPPHTLFDVDAAIERSRAAAWILGELKHGNLMTADSNSRGWAESMCLDELEQRLGEAACILRKLQGTPKAVA